MNHVLGETPRSFRRDARLLRKTDFDRVFQSGQKAVCEAFVLIGSRQTSSMSNEGPRLGLVVSRKVGKAVQRNRIKRRLRSIFRHERASWLQDPAIQGLDLVVIARQQAAELSGPEFERAFKKCCHRLRRRIKPPHLKDAE